MALPSSIWVTEGDYVALFPEGSTLKSDPTKQARQLTDSQKWYVDVADFIKLYEAPTYDASTGHWKLVVDIRSLRPGMSNIWYAWKGHVLFGTGSKRSDDMSVTMSESKLAYVLLMDDTTLKQNPDLYSNQLQPWQKFALPSPTFLRITKNYSPVLRQGVAGPHHWFEIHRTYQFGERPPSWWIYAPHAAFVDGIVQENTYVEPEEPHDPFQPISST